MSERQPPPGWRTRESQNLYRPWSCERLPETTGSYATEQEAIAAAWERHAVDNEELFHLLAQENPEALLLDGFEGALVGVARRCGQPTVAVYDGALKASGIPIPERTDCARCYDQRLGEWWDLWKQHPGIYADAEAQEAKYGHTFRSPSRDTWPAELAELRALFEEGHVPRGVRLQLPLLPPDDPEEYRETRCRVCSL